jgi:hypothetical protein
MEVSKVYISPKNKWNLIIEGKEKNKVIKTHCAIPPTSGNRVDVITCSELETGYRYDVSLIVINIKHGVPWVHLFN